MNKANQIGKNLHAAAMKQILTSLCLTIAVLLGSAGVSWGGRDTEFRIIEFLDGVNSYESEAIAESLGNKLTSSFNLYLTDTHFIYGPQCPNDNEVDCRQNLKFELKFRTASLDLDGDGGNEVIVELIGPNECGSSGCTFYILKTYRKSWMLIGEIFGIGSPLEASKVTKNGFRVLRFVGKYSATEINCIFQGTKYTCQ
tara:strand:- start:759 stop:1355 length:597 start_codon:yes stop_codon:yes gene_type:complete